MKLGVNVNADKSTSIPYTIYAIGMLPECKNLRVDFACNETFDNPDYWERISNILEYSKGHFENIMIHCGYLDAYNKDEYEKFFIYIGKLTDLIVEKGMQDVCILEIWNNLNLDGYWKAGVPGFQNMWNKIKPAVYNAQKQGIRIGGFSFTLNHETAYEWMFDIEEIIRELDILTVQSYPEKEGEFKNHIETLKKFMEREGFTNDIQITEIGAMSDESIEGDDERQECLFRGFMAEVKRYAEKLVVYIYHLWKTEEGDPWWLMRFEEEFETLDGFPMVSRTAIKRPALKYLKEKFTQEELDADRPERMRCCRPQGIINKILCLLRRKGKWIKAFLES